MQAVEEDYDIDSAWSSFLEGGTVDSVESSLNIIEDSKTEGNVPKGTDLYISTKTKIAYLSSPIDLANVFWKVDILPYHLQQEGVVKKQMKFNFTDGEHLKTVSDKLVGLKNVDEQIITQIINPSGRIKFKDIRKISIGLSHKDITSYRSKKKSAFYNCFVLIIRVADADIFKEIHVKVFNTGKLEIPGIRTDELLHKTLDLLTNMLQTISEIKDLKYDKNKSETVLINSNFNCGFYINRDKLLEILKYQYQIDCIFDACQYPGIQCKYAYTADCGQKYHISFMIFRTGSVLIVGKCEEDVLYKIYNNIRGILTTEYSLIRVNGTEISKDAVRIKKHKKKTIYVD
jgi:TATA-box binding protein (TBP) (component of TFIID and TFIIIB)